MDFDRFDLNLTEEEEQALEDLRKAYDKLVLLALQRELGVKLEIIDDEHIAVDGVVMTDDEFEDWLEEKAFELGLFDDESDTHYMA